MNQLLTALLDFSRLSQAEPRRQLVDLSVMAHASAADLQQTEPERRVEFRIADEVTANADSELMQVVLNNLLGNAWKYTRPQEQALIEFGATETGVEQIYFVRDNGPGFDPAEAAEIFTPFKRLAGSEEVRGFGIGLATVERIIHRHGGRIWGEGEKGKGATFYFTLPHSKGIGVAVG